MPDLIVQKFGGTSVGDAKRVKNVAEIITDSYEKGNNIVVVVSAQGDETDNLLLKASEITSSPSLRELDVLLSAGEQISMSLLAMAVQNLGYPAVSFTGWQAGIHTDLTSGNARILDIDVSRINEELDKRNIVIVAGFQGINEHGNITTLGRGGSDTTAVALAAALLAKKCEIYTDVSGVYTADPRIVSGPILLSEIMYDEMLELASAGANVLHNRSVEIAKKYNVEVEVLSSFEKIPGTKVKETVSLEKMLIRGVARDNDVVKISILGLPNDPGVAFKVFSLLAKGKINVDVIIQSDGNVGERNISFTTSKASLKECKIILEGNKETIGYREVVYNDNLSKVSIVGAGMITNPGVASRMFEALFEHDIDIHLISTSEIKITVLVDADRSEAAVNAIHDKFFGNGNAN
jgi:aspartate kinase